MALYAMGKTAAVAAIKAAVSDRVQTMSDGTLKLDTPSLYQWLLDQAQLVIDEDVACERERLSRCHHILDFI